MADSQLLVYLCLSIYISFFAYSNVVSVIMYNNCCISLYILNSFFSPFSISDLKCVYILYLATSFQLKQGKDDLNF